LAGPQSGRRRKKKLFLVYYYVARACIFETKNCI